MNPEPQKPEKDFGRDLKTFDQLPARNRELELLKDQAEKAIGPERVVLDKAIRDKGKP